MAPFSGWLMPIQYQGIVAEHLHTRGYAGLFDLCHMGRLVVTGPDAAMLLQRATTNDVERLKVGAAQYSLMCNERGGVIEDLLVYRFSDHWRLIVNAANRVRVIGHLEGLRDHLECAASVRDDTFASSLLGLQGPASEAVLQPLVEGDLATLRFYHARSETLTLPPVSLLRSGQGEKGPKTVPAVVSRTGYTGEDGFELLADSSVAAEVWARLLADERVRPVGLGARDTLRLEAGMALYGHELTEDVTPYEAGLSRVVRLEKGPFLGSEALARLRQTDPLGKLVGLRLSPGALPRAGCRVTKDGLEAGEVASGTFSPTLKCPIATAYVRSNAAALGTNLAVIVRGAAIPAWVVSLPFVPHSTKR